MVVVAFSFISITESPGVPYTSPPDREFGVSAILSPYDPIHGKMRYSGSVGCLSLLVACFSQRTCDTGDTCWNASHAKYVSEPSLLTSWSLLYRCVWTN
jgi:hypothetical protein